MAGMESNRGVETNDKPVFWSAFYCPYAQRAWIALEMKQIAYEWKETILYEDLPSSKKSLSLEEKRIANGDDFIDCSPRGLIPALRHGDARVWDSLALIEYIEEAFPCPDYPLALMPTDFQQRAHIRAGMALFSEVVIRRFYAFLMAEGPEARNAAALAYAKGFDECAPFFEGSPFFSPFGFSLFECSSLPWYQRTLSVLKHYRGFELNSNNCKSFKQWETWYSACLDMPGFAKTIVDETRLIDNYKGYADGTATSNAAQLTKPLLSGNKN